MHDQSWLFIGGYVSLAVVLSIWISLFWLLAVVGAHFVLEWIRQRHLHPHRPAVLARVCWELKLDFALILFALALSAYMDLMLGLAGLGGAARLAGHVGSRAAGWTRAFRGVLLSLDDAAQLAKAAFLKRAGGSANGGGEAFLLWAGWNQKWSWREWLVMILAGGCVLSLVAVPLLTQHDYASLFRTLAHDLHPWP
jgi:hypothetical protein